MLIKSYVSADLGHMTLQNRPLAVTPPLYRRLWYRENPTEEKMTRTTQTGTQR